eukprot:GHVU01166154.1.p4 GENE.GHVU01166154.1~~GHVU01166154.1.p4  ORF type:complete len:101 (+),score=21.87 GHVU01166154.1:56-358(+)
MGKFSTDRTIRKYAENIWGITECERPRPDEISAPEAPIAMEAELAQETRGQETASKEQEHAVAEKNKRSKKKQRGSKRRKRRQQESNKSKTLRRKSRKTS